MQIVIVDGLATMLTIFAALIKMRILQSSQLSPLLAKKTNKECSK
jgi:hypothetical protein